MTTVKYFTKNEIIAAVTAIEAGYVNNPADSGGETNHGITKAVAESRKTQLVALYGWNGKMKDLSYDMALYIYDVEFWQKLRLDDVYNVSSFLADKMFDIGVNCGISKSALWLQEILNVSNNRGTHWADIKMDGIMGSGTLKAIDSFIAKRGKHLAMTILIKGLLYSQGRHYIDSSLKYEKNETFFVGWMNRTDHNLEAYFAALSGTLPKK